MRVNGSPRGTPSLSRAWWIAALLCAIVGAGVLTDWAVATAAARAKPGTKTVLTSYRGQRGWQLVVEINDQKLTLYAFSSDHRGSKNGESTCYGRCQKVWLPLIDRGGVVIANGSCRSSSCHINEKQFKTARRKDGSLQVTYYGWPLYRYRKDTKTGQTQGADNCDFGGAWGPMSTNGSGPPSPPIIY